MILQYCSPWPVIFLKYNLSEDGSTRTVVLASGILKYNLSEDSSTGTVLQSMASGILKYNLSEDSSTMYSTAAHGQWYSKI